MPLTTNGIGTRYYGRRNVVGSVEACEFCGQLATLSNYNTTHWFVVFYLPVIPLGKKQIFSDCSHCRKHRAMSLGEWEGIQSRAIQKAQEASDAAPSDPAAAIELLGVLYSCFRRAEARDLARELHDRFAKDANVQLAVADCLDLCGASDEAERAYLTALELDRDNLRAKRAVARSLLQKNEPDTAHRLILTAPRLEATHDPLLFAQLGNAYAAEGRHDKALAAFQEALAAAPALGRDENFHRSMKAAEQAAGVERSSLPRVSWFRQHRRALAISLILALASLPVSWNFYVAGHQTLHIVNGFDIPLNVRLEDGSQLTAPARSHITATIAEGEHEVTVSAGNRQLQGGKFEVASSVMDRFRGMPVFVLNPGCGATLLWEQVIYGPPLRERAGPLPPQPSRFILGQLFQTFSDVDYVFREFPHQLEVKGGLATKRRVTLAPQETALIVEAPREVARADDRLRLAETHLPLAPGNAKLRLAYLKAGDDAGQRERAEKFLAGLAER